MRFRFTLLLLALLSLSSVPLSARDFTYTYAGQTLKYTVISETDRTCETAEGKKNDYFTPGNKIKGRLEIPSVVKYNDKEYKVISIPNYAFSCCEDLISVKLPDSVAKIGKYAFFSCTSLLTINTPLSLTDIYPSAFCGCESLSYFNIPNSISGIGEYTFSGCSNLKNVIIPNSVTFIGMMAFYKCSSITDLIIPNTVSEIRNQAFWGCSSLTSVTISNSITSLRAGLFGDCINLINIVIPNSVIAIGESTFSNCRNLINLNIPYSVEIIDGYAFNGCSALKNVYCSSLNPPKVFSPTFKDVPVGEVTLHVPRGRKYLYQNAFVWKDFGCIVEEDMNGIEKVEDDELYDGVDFELPYQVFDLNGKFLGNSTESLASGIYIIKQGSAIMKMAVN